MENFESWIEQNMPQHIYSSFQLCFLAKSLASKTGGVCAKVLKCTGLHRTGTKAMCSCLPLIALLILLNIKVFFLQYFLSSFNIWLAETAYIPPPGGHAPIKSMTRLKWQHRTLLANEPGQKAKWPLYNVY